MSSDGAQSPPAYAYTVEKAAGADKAIGPEATPISDVNAGRLSIDSGGKIDQTHRLLKSRHIQLIGIGGSIGTVLYVRLFVKIPNPNPPYPCLKWREQICSL